MAAPLGDQTGAGETPKRPAPTIDGEAEEISVESGEASSGTHETPVLSAPEQKPETDAAAETEPKAETEREAETESAAGHADASDGASEPHEPAAPPPNTDGKQLTSFFTHLAAGFVGGLVGVAALAFAWQLFPAAITGKSSDKTSDLEARVAALEAKPHAASQQSLATLQSHVAGLQTTLNDLAAQAKKGGSVTDAAAVSQQIQAAEKRLQDEMNQRLAKLGNAASSSDLQTLRTEVSGLQQKLASLSAAQASTAAQAETSGANQQQLASLSTRLGALESKLNGLSGTIDKTSSEAKAASSEAKAATTAAALSDLRAAALSGQAYGDQLATYQALAPQDADLSPLPDHAANGLPTLAALKADFAPAQVKALAGEVTPAKQDFLGTLLSSAESVVKIRKLNSAGAGSGPDAVLSRAAGDLDRGDLAAAVKEVKSLQGTPATAMTDWLSKAELRLAAETAFARLSRSQVSKSQPPAADAAPQGQSGL